MLLGQSKILLISPGSISLLIANCDRSDVMGTSKAAADALRRDCLVPTANLELEKWWESEGSDRSPISVATSVPNLGLSTAQFAPCNPFHLLQPVTGQKNPPKLIALYPVGRRRHSVRHPTKAS